MSKAQLLTDSVVKIACFCQSCLGKLKKNPVYNLNKVSEKTEAGNRTVRSQTTK